MSWLSELSGVHISPHHFSVEPGKLLGDVAMATGVGGLAGRAGSLLARAIGHGGNSAPAPSGGYDVTDPSQNVYAPPTPDSGSSGVGGFLSGAVKSALGGGQPGQSSTNPWLLGLAGLQGANSAYLGQKSNALSDKALKGVEANYAERAPLRAAGLRGLLNPTAPDTTQLSTIAQRNPYAAPPTPVG